MLAVRVRSGYGSESEVEDETSKVELADEFGKGNHAAHQSSVKLHEVGPRMSLQLVKVEEGLCSGPVMFHEYGKIFLSRELLSCRKGLDFSISSVGEFFFSRTLWCYCPCQTCLQINMIDLLTVKKTPEEIAELRALVEKREALRKQRKAEQEANVKKKE